MIDTVSRVLPRCTSCSLDSKYGNHYQCGVNFWFLFATVDFHSSFGGHVHLPKIGKFQVTSLPQLKRSVVRLITQKIKTADLHQATSARIVSD